MRRRSPAVAASVALCACATPAIDADAPRNVTAHPLPAYAVHEECMTLAPGDRIDYLWQAQAAIGFNIHYHEANAVVLPVSRERTRAESGVYRAVLAQDYCLMWEALAQPTTLDYRIRVLRAPVSR